MTDNGAIAAITLGFMGLFYAFGGDPDLMDAIINWIGRH